MSSPQNDGHFKNCVGILFSGVMVRFLEGGSGGGGGGRWGGRTISFVNYSIRKLTEIY